MVIAGGAKANVPLRERLTGFNGAGDGDRRRGCTPWLSWVRTSRFNGAGDGDRRRVAPHHDGGRLVSWHASTEPAMVIAGGPSRECRWRTFSSCFNGAGDGDRRRGIERWTAIGDAIIASTEPAMVIAGGLFIEAGSKRHDIPLQRSRRW